MVLPPPRATITSHWCSLTNFTPFLTDEIFGLGSIPSHSTISTLDFFNEATALSKVPFLFTEPLPVTNRALLPKAFTTSPSFSRLPLPNKTLVGL